MPQKTFVLGVGMTKFERPGSRDWDYPDMTQEAACAALSDAGVAYDEVDQATVGYVYGESTCGQRSLYGIGMTGVPIYNVNNTCATGSTALLIARQLVAGGLADCVLAVGFEKMEKGSLEAKYADRAIPIDRHVYSMVDLRGWADAPAAAQLFGNAGREHMDRWGSTPKHFAEIARKNHQHSASNPFSQFQDVYSLAEIESAPMVFDPLTRLQCCPTSEGAAAAVVCSERFLHSRVNAPRAIEIAGMSMATDRESTFDRSSCIDIVGSKMTEAAADEAYEQSGLGPEDIDVIELHDCFSTNELLTYEALKLCPEGKGGRLVEEGATTYGGEWVVNPSGGLISKGHPLGATGLAQCSELVWQLRGEADGRQVHRPRAALQHNIGLGGAAVVTVYRPTSAA